MTLNRTRPAKGRIEVKTQISSKEQVSFSIFPAWRLFGYFPWPIWLAGWLAIFKAFLWLATDPVIPNPLAGQMASKFLLTMVPFAVLGVGIWNLRKWAVWSLLILSVIDLMFYIVFPGSLRYIAGNNFIGLAIVLLICTGPLGNIMILAAGPSMFKHSGKSEYFKELASE